MGRFDNQLASAQRAYDNQSPPGPADGLIENGDAGEYIRECCGDEFFDKCDYLVQGWLQGPQDKFAETRLVREFKELADWYAEECRAEDERRRVWRPD